MEPQPEFETTQINLTGYFRLLRDNRNFRRLWLAQIVSEMGDWFYTLAIYSLLLEMTGKAAAVGLALVLQVLPQTLIGPTAGVVNDRIRRKHVMIVADIARFFIVLAMLFVRSQSTVWLVYPLLVLEAVMWGFFEPGRSAVIPNICHKEDIVLANTLSSTTWSMNLFLGAAVGGFVAALLGRQAVFVLNAFSFLVSAWFIRGMHFEEPHTEHTQLRVRELVDFSTYLEGIRYVLSNVRLTAMIFIKFGLFAMGPSWVLFTVLGRTDFPVRWHGLSLERGAILGMSLLMAARGIGALIGPLISAPWAGHDDRRLRRAILAGYIASAAGYICLGFSGNLAMAIFSAILGHIGGASVWVFSTTLLQLNTDDRFRGRVFAADFGLCMLTLAVGAYIGGYLLDHGMTARTLAYRTGFLTLVPAVAWLFAQRLWRGSPATLAPESE
jgi:MFS family permease